MIGLCNNDRPLTQLRRCQGLSGKGASRLAAGFDAQAYRTRQPTKLLTTSARRRTVPLNARLLDTTIDHVIPDVLQG